MPKHYRERLIAECSGDLVVTYDPSPCLLIYTLENWEEVEQEMNNLPTTTDVARSMHRLIVGHACDVQLDGTGRLLLPQELREEAGIERKVVLMGQGKKFELWDEETWNAEKERAKKLMKGKAEGQNPIEAPPEMLSISL